MRLFNEEALLAIGDPTEISRKQAQKRVDRETL